MCVVGAGLLVAARGPAPTLDQSIADATSRSAAAHAPIANLAPIAPAKATAAPKASPAPVEASSPVKPVAVEKTPAPAVALLAAKPVAAPAPAATPIVLSHEPAPKEAAEAKPATELVAKADTPRTTPVTITGCLEASDDSFRLTGTDAPKARSWRSGFLVKRSSSIELIDPAKTARLTNYVGQRVAATGMLVNREMEVRSVQRLAASSCKS